MSENGQKSYDLNERLILLGFERGSLYFPKRDFRTRREGANRNRGKIERKQVRGRAKTVRKAQQILDGEMRGGLYLLGLMKVSLLRMDFWKIETPYLSGGGEGSRTPVRNSSDQMSTRVECHSSREASADTRAKRSSTVRFGSLQRANGASCNEIN